jgi:hypothetical protein
MPATARVVTVFFLLALTLADAHADDSSAQLGTGGLVLTRSEEIRLADEYLRISPKDVTARFTFVNDSKGDIDILVAFPLPDIDTSRFSEEPLGRTISDPLNFIGFSVTEDGKKVPFQVEQRAFYNGKDVTGVLRRAGVPLNIVDPRFSKMLDGLASQQRASLEAADLIDRENGSYAHPHWLVRTKFWWRQHFPAGKAIVLDEHYQPVTGESLIGRDELDPTSQNGRYWLKTYCMDAEARSTALALLARNRANPQSGNLLTALATEYVLSTGHNWKGPIGRFRLVLDKLKHENVVSLCWAGRLESISPTTFAFTRENFAPKEDIKLLVLEQAPL